MTHEYKLPEMFQKIAKDSLKADAATPQETRPSTPSRPTNTPLSSTMQKQLDQANSAINSLAKEYPNWAARDIKHMYRLLGDAKSISGNERTALIRKELFKVAHDAKGQGATFGYPLVTDVGEHLCRYIEGLPAYDSESLGVIKQHIDALDKILKQKLTGNGDVEGAKIRAEILTPLV